jgi:hypothetical protein
LTIQVEGSRCFSDPRSYVVDVTPAELVVVVEMADRLDHPVGLCGKRVVGEGAYPGSACGVHVRG